MKTKRNKHKFLISLVALFTMLMCVSVGFASWLVTSGSNALALGQIEADNVETSGQTGENLDVITIDQLQVYQYASSRGFVYNYVYSNTVDLAGTCSFDSQNGKRCIDSFNDNNSKSFAMDVTLTTELVGGFSGNGITSNSIALTSTNFADTNIDPTDSTDISGSFSITCFNNNSNFTFDFTIHLVWGGSNLSSFPNLSSADFCVQFALKENTL